MFNTNLSATDLLYLSQGALVTVEITLLSMLIGTVIGVLCGFLRAGLPRASAPLAWFLDIFRSVPLLIQFVVFNSFKGVVGLDWSAFSVACLVLGLYAASYCTEIIRAGVLAVPPGLRRASRSLGMTWWQDIRSIVLPLATRVSFPGWLNVLLSVLKDTALVFWIGIIELLRSAQQLNVRLNEPMLIFFLAGVFYYVICLVIARLGNRLEKQWNLDD